VRVFDYIGKPDYVSCKLAAPLLVEQQTCFTYSVLVVLWFMLSSGKGYVVPCRAERGGEKKFFFSDSPSSSALESPEGPAST
jgi:hypothetical protein